MTQPIPDQATGTVRFVTTRYQLRLLTPAFLGDADQHGRWRTPPIKALLRQWWRVVWAAENGFPHDVQRLRHEEGALFGHAWLEDDRDDNGMRVRGRRSALRVRLEAPDPNQPAWTKGHQRGVAPLADGLSTSYAWFGLLDSKTKTPLRSGIQPGEAEGRRALKLAWPEHEDDRIRRVMQLIRDFGQLGYRSRGGWGALHVEDVEPLGPDELARLTRPLEECLTGEWPASFAADANGVMRWQGQQTYADWSRLMAHVAGLRKEIRDALKSTRGGDLRPVLGTAEGGRVANPLRWRPVLEAGGQLRLRIFAMPWRVGSQLRTVSTAKLATAWQVVARTLDQHSDLERSVHS